MVTDKEPPPQCDHPEGYWRWQIIEVHYWDHGTLKWRRIRKQFWRCETCRGIER